MTKAPLTVTASSASMTYGGTPPAVTPAYSGFVNGDNPSSLTTQATCSTTATSSSPASPPTYPTTCTGASGPNYAVSYSAGAITINRAALTVTASNASSTYGSTPPAIIPGYAGFVNGDTASSLTTKPTCTTTATGSSPVSGSPYSSSCTGAVDANYSIAYVPGAVTVNQAALTVTAASVSMTYGSTPPAITALYTGFVNNDTASSLTTEPTCTTTATSASPVAGSPYSSSCTGASDPNYAIGYATGTVAVTKAPLTVTASSGSMTYGGTPPTVTPAYNGFVNGDNPSSLTSQATCSTTATSSSPASPPTYPTTCTGTSGPNYAVSYVAGAITVNRAVLTVTASNGSMTYGGTAPPISPAYSGFVNGDSPASLTTAPTCSDHRHELELCGGIAVLVVMRRGGRPQLRVRLRAGRSHGHPGPTHRHSLERLHDLRRHAADHLARVQRLRQRGQRIVADEEACLLDDGHQREPGDGLAVLLVVLGRGRRQLHHHRHPGFSHGQHGSPHDHGLECVHDLRGHAAGRHTRLQRLQER